MLRKIVPATNKTVHKFVAAACRRHSYHDFPAQHAANTLHDHRGKFESFPALTAVFLIAFAQHHGGTCSENAATDAQVRATVHGKAIRHRRYGALQSKRVIIDLKATPEDVEDAGHAMERGDVRPKCCLASQSQAFFPREAIREIAVHVVASTSDKCQLTLSELWPPKKAFRSLLRPLLCRPPLHKLAAFFAQGRLVDKQIHCGVFVVTGLQQRTDGSISRETKVADTVDGHHQIHCGVFVAFGLQQRTDCSISRETKVADTVDGLALHFLAFLSCRSSSFNPQNAAISCSCCCSLSAQQRSSTQRSVTEVQLVTSTGCGPRSQVQPSNRPVLGASWLGDTNK
jgi:hypothetical protein